MPLVAHNSLPAFQRLRESGHEVLSLERATHQDIRELHIGFLNMMPDAALKATEQQFIRMVGSSNPIAQFYVYPFSLPELKRGASAREHIAAHYFDFAELASKGLDAVIITGANVTNPSLDQEDFWNPLIEVAEWAASNVASILCSCLATHALLRNTHNISRHLMPEKQWGVFSHTIRAPDHPLMRDVNTRFDAPHSRFNDVSIEQLEAAGVRVLVHSEEAGMHLAVSPDQIRTVYFQGHPEYDAVSLLKEYKREVYRFLRGETDVTPPYPKHYFSPAAKRCAEEFMQVALIASGKGHDLPPFPEDEMAAMVDNTWGDTGRAIVNNWLGLVYKLTNLDRKLQYMPGVDPANPLGLLP